MLSVETIVAFIGGIVATIPAYYMVLLARRRWLREREQEQQRIHRPTSEEVQRFSSKMSTILASLAQTPPLDSTHVAARAIQEHFSLPTLDEMRTKTTSQEQLIAQLEERVRTLSKDREDIRQKLPEALQEAAEKMYDQIEDYLREQYNKRLLSHFVFAHAWGVIHVSLLIRELLKIRAKEPTDITDKAEYGMALSTVFTADVLAFTTREIRRATDRIEREIKSVPAGVEGVSETNRILDMLETVRSWIVRFEDFFATSKIKLPREAEQLSTEPPKQTAP